MYTINIFFLEPAYPKTLFQTTFNHTNDEVVEYKIQKIFNKKSGQWFIQIEKILWIKKQMKINKRVHKLLNKIKINCVICYTIHLKIT